ncbi:MAG: O-antigen ligase family protein [Patescibacteria group bacterium]
MPHSHSATKINSEVLLTIWSIALVGLFVFGSWYFSLNLFWLYLLCLAPVGIAILKYPAIGAYVIVFCTLVFERWFTLQSIPWGDQLIKFYPLDLIIVFWLVAVVIRLLAGEQKPVWPNRKLVWGLGIFFAVVLLNFIRAIFAKEIDLALAFSTVKNFALYGVIYWLMINSLLNREQWRRFCGALLAGGLALCYFVVYGFLTGRGLWIEYVPLSTWGTRLLGGPHSFYLLILIILLISWLVGSERRFSRQDYLYLALLLVFGLGLVGSLQRHLWLALPLGLGVTLWFYRPAERWRFLRLAGLGVMAVVFILALSFWLASWESSNFLLGSDIIKSLQLRVVSFFNSAVEDSSAYWRVRSWQQAWEWFKTNPLFGVGLGRLLNFQVDDVKHYIPMRDLHNDFVSVAVQMGLAGILAFLFMLLQIGRSFLAVYRRLPTADRLVYTGFFSLVVVFFFVANFGVYLDLNLYVVWLWLFLGSLTVIERLNGLKG